MKEEMQHKLNEFKIKKKLINLDWFERFFNMLEQVGIDEELILKTMDMVFCEEFLSKYLASGKNIFNNCEASQETRDEFFKYMSDMAKKVGTEKFKGFLENSLVEIQKDYKQYLEEGHSAKTNFVNLFIRRLVIENPKDVKLEITGAKVEDINEGNSGRIAVSIAGIEIGHLLYEGEKYNIPTITFTDFRTIPGLERLGLGSFMFTTFCRDICEKRPECSVMAFNVAKDKDGEKTYLSWGAYPIVITMKDEIGKEIEIRPMTEKEHVGNGHIFYFSPETIKKCAQKEIKKYSQQDLLSDEMSQHLEQE